MKKTIRLFVVILFPTFSLGQNVINSVNSGATSNNNLTYSVGEVYVVPIINPNEANSGLIGILSRIDFFVTGINEQLISADIKVFPNPTKKTVFLEIPNDIVFHKIYVYDIKGKLMLQTDNKTSSIDLSDFPDGIYTIQTDNNQINSLKIIKQ
ncbi:MAG: T9SS type A sorting domain-containing protein [Paludibacteraceae bacterium]